MAILFMKMNTFEVLFLFFKTGFREVLPVCLG
jgi:hypothetical protein